MLNPWQLELKSREAANWMLKKWMKDHGGNDGSPFGWTPWVLTAQNNDDQPISPQGEAEQIFQHLKTHGVFYDLPVDLPTNGKVITQTFKDQLEVSRFISKTDIITMKLMPLVLWALSNRFIVLGIAALTYAASSFCGAFLSKLGELLAQRCF